MQRYTIETERETDGRWIAEVLELPGVMTYGSTKEEAQARVESLALNVLFEKLHIKKAQHHGYLAKRKSHNGSARSSAIGMAHKTA